MFTDNPKGYAEALNYLVSIDRYSDFIENKELDNPKLLVPFANEVLKQNKPSYLKSLYEKK